jgi:hypothetical protein
MKTFASIVLMVSGFYILSSCPQYTMVSADDEPAAIHPFIFHAVLTDGQKAGDLTLGQTTLEQAVKMFPEPPVPSYGGEPRAPQGYPPVRVGKIRPNPAVVFNPWNTMYALYFDKNNKLVIISELVTGKISQKEIAKQYPKLKETDRGSGSFEMQAEIQPCVAFMALFRTADSSMDQSAYAFTCETE